jgi:DNA-binding NarL/FixJ family response regulator
MSYSERTVKNVLHDITTGLQLRNRSHAVAYALREGLI